MLNIELEIDAPPPHSEHKISPWIDEQIWGHRLYDQSEWLLFLEFLSVAEAKYRDNRLFDAINESGNFYPLNYRPNKRMHLRNILFNNDEIFRINEQYPGSDTAWDAWLKWMAEKAQGVHSRDFSYLKKCFGSFAQFSKLVGMLQRSNVEAGSNKRWSSRFVFPFGTNALYEDLDVKSGNPVRDYTNFGRTGEILYLMLSRSTSAEKLKENFIRIFQENNEWNELLRLMQPEDHSDDAQIRGRSYLPYKKHFNFDRLGEDWLNIFKLKLPSFDAFPHLVTLSALHILLYQLDVSREMMKTDMPLYFVCEIIAPKKTLVRQLSAQNYIRNNLLPAQAVESYINEIEASKEWQDALNSEHDAFNKCRQILSERVRWAMDVNDYAGPSDCGSLITALREIALKGHKQHAGNIHRNFGRDIGLVSKRGTNRLRYAPTDALLKTMLLTNMEKRMELGEFLETLFNRYGFVFGDREAARVLPSDEFDKKVFQANAHRLEQRLGSLGMLRRLSDGCAYVENPYRQS